MSNSKQHNADSPASKQHHPHVSTIGRTERHKCYRCRRVLPWDQFGRLPKSFPRKGKMLLHPYCFKCREQAKGKYADHPLYSPGVDRFFDKLMTSVNSGAYERQLVVAIDKDDLWQLYIEQNGLCALSGVKLNHQRTGGVEGDEPSVDRIDSSGHYTHGNIQLVCRTINIMKMALPQTAFIGWCQRVARYQRVRHEKLAEALTNQMQCDNPSNQDEAADA